MRILMGAVLVLVGSLGCGNKPEAAVVPGVPAQSPVPGPDLKQPPESGPEPAQPPTPAAEPKQPATLLPEAVVKAWKDAGADLGWMAVDDFGFPRWQGKASARAVPAFKFYKWEDGVVAKLPAPPAH